MIWFKVTGINFCMIKKSFCLAVLLPFVVTNLPLFGQELPKHPDKPLLWKIEGGDLEKPSYLFGTIHLGAPEVTTLHPAAKKAFDSSESLYTEIPMDAAAQMAMLPMLMRKDGKTLDEAIGPDLAARVNEELQLINPALDSKPFQPMATWIIGMMIPLLPDQMAGRVALDQTLWDKATAAGKQTGGLETPESQMGIFTQMTEQEQTIMLAESLKTLKKDRDLGRNSMDLLIAAYVSGDLSAVEAEIDRAMAEMEAGENAELGKKMMKRLLEDRDASMAVTIGEILKKEPATVHFFAAGSAHFASKTSIRNHLEEAGYKITRISE